MKKCSKCKEEKSLDSFGKLKRGKDGKCSYCKQCAKGDYDRYVEANKEKIQERSKEYVAKRWSERRKDKSQHYINELIKNGIRRYIVDKRGKSYRDILGDTFDNVRLHIERQFKEGMSWSNFGEWHIDHIVPLASGNNNDEWIKLNHYTNLQPLWAKENLQKGARI
jgi:hypothetical protein